MSEGATRDTPLPQAVTLVLAGLLAAGLAFAMLDLPSPSTRLAQAVEANLDRSGVRHPVTSVLLNFRGYDTLLEIAVLLVATLGVLALNLVATDADPVSDERASPVLATLVDVVVPLMIVLAGYLLWAGSHRPGGAFQAGAILAGAGVLLRLAGRWQPPPMPSAFARAGLSIGFGVFLAVALGTFLAGGSLLEYPPVWAGNLILLIEASLTVSIGLMLLGLFGGAPAPGRP